MNKAYRLLLHKGRNDVRMLTADPGRQRGPRSAIKLAVEQLEPRTLLAGDVALLDPTMDSPAAPPPSQVALILQVTKPDGTTADTIHVGENFVLHVLAKDLRDDPHGVFAAYLDLLWDDSLATIAGPQEFGGDYPNGHKGNASTAGLLDEAGAFSGQDELDGKLYEVFSVPLRAIAPGTLALQSDPADFHPQYDVLVYGTNAPVSESVISFGSASLTITAAAGEPAADSPATGDTSPLANESVTELVAVSDAPSADSTAAADAELILIAHPPSSESTAAAPTTPVLLLPQAVAAKAASPASAGSSELPTEAANDEPDAPEESITDAATAQVDLTLL